MDGHENLEETPKQNPLHFNVWHAVIPQERGIQH